MTMEAVGIGKLVLLAVALALALAMTGCAATGPGPLAVTGWTTPRRSIPKRESAGEQLAPGSVVSLAVSCGSATRRCARRFLWGAERLPAPHLRHLRPGNPHEFRG